MRLAQFRLERYGPFERLDLPFDPTQGRVNLIVAPNGYGKSVIRRSIGDFLFGIEARTPMAFRFGTEKMRIMADVIQDGRTRSLARRKGNGNTLALADGAEVPPDEARRLLGGADAKLFHELFGLDTTLLRDGGQDLIRSQGRLGQVLFAAGGGMGRVRDLLDELARKRDDLGKATARHKTRPLWGALSAWEQGNADLRRTALRPDGWSTLKHRAEETAQTLAALLAEQADAARERDRLRTIGACRPWLDRQHAARLVLADAQDAPDLDKDFEKRWRDALQQGVVSAGTAEAARLDLNSARQARADLSFDPDWIAAEAGIAALGDLRGVAAQCEIDLPNLERELAAEQAKAASLRRDLGWDAALTPPPTAIVKDAQRRAGLHPKLAAAATSATEALADAERALAATTAELAGLPNQGDIAAVDDLARLLRADGDPAIRLDTGRRRLRDTEAALRAALAAIPDCPLPESALDATAAPSEVKLEAAGMALTQAEAAAAQTMRDRDARETDLVSTRDRLSALERTARLPPPDALAQTRARRETLWTQLRAPERHEPALAVALDRAMREADDIADALIAHGTEVAEATLLRGHLATLETERTREADRVARLCASVADARGVLLAMARAAGGTADDVSGLRRFLEARARAVAARADRDAAAAELRDLAATLGTLAARLAAAMAVAPRDLTELGALLAEADRRIDAERDLAATRKALTEQIRRQRAAQATAIAAAEKASRTLTDWDAGWRAIATSLVRPDNEVPATTADALMQIEELRKTEAAATDKQDRIDGMRAAIEQLRVRVARLGALSPDLAALPPTEAAERFRQRLQAELQQAVLCRDADRRIEQRQAKLANAAAEAATAARALEGLRAALRAETNDEADRQLERFRSAAAARADRTEALRELAVQGGGLSVEALAARAGETTAEADLARIAEIDADQQARLPLIEAARDANIAAAAELDRAGSGMDAAEAAQRREAAQALLARTTEEALVLHATHALLQAALDRQAAGADQPLLARIGEVFRTITGGAQGGVRIEDTGDGQTMVALEADGVTRKALHQLSEGTSDQLYLALRVAALEDYAAATPPLPFIADDILQTFDDARTAATLHALLGLSELVQVIVLTHHPHVGDLAARLPGDAVRVMRLEP